jgi:HEAT repeat protein
MAAGKIEERLKRLRRLRNAPTDGKPDAEIDGILRRALEDRSNLIVAEAAKLAALHSLAALVPHLIAALTRLFEDPVKSDPKCWGKTAIVKAIAELNHDESPPFLRAMGHVQMEPVWGGQEDAAVLLRSNATLGLIQCLDLTRHRKFQLLVDMLADPADPVRAEAVRAIEQLDGEEPVLLLRLKAHAGDPSPQVTGQVFDSLLQLEGARAVPFVAAFMTSGNAKEEVRDEAALALGGSRLAAAVAVLMEAYRNARSAPFRATLLRALSASRDETALEFLLQVVDTGLSRDAAAAIEALELHQDLPHIQKRLTLARERGGKAGGTPAPPGSS